MPSRSFETSVTFVNAFTIGDAPGRCSPGTYRLVIDEDEIPGISFLAYRRVATLFQTPAIGTPGPQQLFSVDRADVDAALDIDRRLELNPEAAG